MGAFNFVAVIFFFTPDWWREKLRDEFLINVTLRPMRKCVCNLGKVRELCLRKEGGIFRANIDYVNGGWETQWWKYAYKILWTLLRKKTVVAKAYLDLGLKNNLDGSNYILWYNYIYSIVLHVILHLMPLYYTTLLYHIIPNAENKPLLCCNVADESELGMSIPVNINQTIK